jgi:hypothetical protein
MSIWWAVALVAAAAPVEAPTLAAWHGQWEGEGQAFGKPATATLVIESGEQDATTLAYRLSIEGESPVRYSADAVYALDAKRRVHGQWTDSYGRTRPVSGGVARATWWVHWGSADVEIGRSIYALNGDGTLTVSDSVLQDDGGWRLFAMLRYRRTNG